ncbi:MAG: NADP-dependent oxidoreductase [Gammaproteobacteria bacterium]|nr:NADP-dependent oxidoreductase [Gammaproteobacteria bacterium]
MENKNLQIILHSRPTAGISELNFALQKSQIPFPQAGEVLLKTLYLSLDPYMRGRMYDTPSYAASVKLGAVMIGETISEVIQSNNANFSVGQLVSSAHGWQQYAISDGSNLVKLPEYAVSPSAYLGILGLTGLTGYGALIRYGQPKAGETLVVSAANGSVGSIVAQTGRNLGCNVIGITGGQEKCKILETELSIKTLDYKDDNFSENLKKLTPQGIDIFFDNVGGDIAFEALNNMAIHGRFLVCGTISFDRNLPQVKSIDRFPSAFSQVLIKRLKVQGFIFDELVDMKDDYHQQAVTWLKDGKLTFREHIVEGIENAPQAFMSLFKGKNVGKLIIKI